MATRVFLGFSALLWFLYGIYCFVVPGSLAEAAGVALDGGFSSYTAMGLVFEIATLVIASRLARHAPELVQSSS